MVRRISTKWVLAVLAVVVLPFLGFAWYVDAFVSQRFSDDVVRYHLLGHAAEPQSASIGSWRSTSATSGSWRRSRTSP